MTSELQKRVTGSSSFNDFQTPDYATDILIPYLKVRGFRYIWEPACGFGFIADRLKDYGFNAYRSDIRDVSLENDLLKFNLDQCKDFLTFSDLPDPKIDCIVTNPPYSIKDEFLKKCYELEIPFALLMPLRALGAQKRVHMYLNKGIELLVPDKRVDFLYKKDKKANWFHVAWYCFNILPEKLMFTTMEKK
jgi:hypothetical protein